MAIAWEPPVYEITELTPKRTRYCVIIMVLNEGDRLRKQLGRMQPNSGIADIIIADGRSTDGSTDPEFLRSMNVRALLSTGERGLSTATRMGLAYAMEQGYDGTIIIDGNGKDGVEAIPKFLDAMDNGYDLIQGSRFAKGGVHKNTPLERYIGIRFVMGPLLALGCGFWYTDSTNSFRGLSMRFLKDERVQPIRNIFVDFNLHPYLMYRSAKLGFKVKEIPVVRVYPDDGSIPTKITSWKHRLRVINGMLTTITGGCNPR